MDFEHLDLEFQNIFKGIDSGRDFHRAVRDKYGESIRMTLGFCNICFDVTPENTLMIFDSLCNNQFIDWSGLPMYYFEDFEGEKLNMVSIQKNLLNIAREEVSRSCAKMYENYTLARAAQGDHPITLWTTGAILNKLQDTDEYNAMSTYKVSTNAEGERIIEVDPFDTISNYLLDGGKPKDVGETFISKVILDDKSK